MLKTAVVNFWAMQEFALYRDRRTTKAKGVGLSLSLFGGLFAEKESDKFLWKRLKNIREIWATEKFIQF
jgi:hypothetical protein